MEEKATDTIDKGDLADLRVANATFASARSAADAAASAVEAAKARHESAIMRASMAEMVRNNVVAAIQQKHQLPDGCTVNDGTGAISYPQPASLPPP